MISRVFRFRRGKFATIAFALFSAVACDSLLAPLPQGRPNQLEFLYGGFGMDSYQWELRGDTVVYRLRGPLSSVPIDSSRKVPTNAEWDTFWAAVDRAGIRRWRERYVAEGVVDGSGWQLRLRGGSFALESTGSNAFPDRKGHEHEHELTSEFQLLLDALADLTLRTISH